ncbi:ADP-ribosylglycohydrolase family protein [Alienimonas californiensis]|uniref:ADP-ribosylglycohydrolase n=1 Tax=Alienimonas californiensis TaxID=2527989 RepID=A0A517PFV8_9PLAN|nr:ADP-ribosylglycohydrolase family protein [Alienimonas californiensis]QDT18234.1 ADP-ribosylglycohydrolase [Alienimonas californiensis]
MLGAVAGDVIGSVWEIEGWKSPYFEPLIGPECRFTDDTVLTCAVAEALLTDGDYARHIRTFARRYPHAGYGGNFQRWFRSDRPGPYNSWGNGSAMRVSPVGWTFQTADETLAEAERSAAVTHNHPRGVAGAQATALAVFMARTGAAKEAIKAEIAGRFDYDLNRTLAEIRPRYCFDVSCDGSVPEALIAFLESTDYESAVRNAVSLGGDADTQAAIAGAVAEAFYQRTTGVGVPAAIAAEVRKRLPDDLTDVLDRFTANRA